MKVITIGRSTENNIVINDAKVSRIHLQLVLDDNGISSVVDLNSANGTFVNGQKITEEVRLQPHDVIRIGNTTLSWQEYIKSSYSVEQTSKDMVHPTQKANRIWWYVAACAVIVLLAGSIGVCFYYDGKERGKMEDSKRNQEDIQEEELHQEAEQKAEKAKRLQYEADELFRQALILQSDKSEALAEAKQKEANEAKKYADEATAAQHKAESARKVAEKAKEEADRAKAAAEQNSQKAIQNAQRTADKASQAISKANIERDLANVKARLTEKFYEEYAAMKSDFAKKVYRQIQYDLPKDEKDAKTALKNLFNQSDNKVKQIIVNAIEVVKRQNSKSKTNESEIKSDSLKSLKDNN